MNQDNKDWKNIAHRIARRNDSYRSPERQPTYPFARSDAAPSPPQVGQDNNPDVITWRLMAPSSSLVH